MRFCVNKQLKSKVLDILFWSHEWDEGGKVQEQTNDLCGKTG